MQPGTEAPTLSSASVRAGGVAVVRIVLGVAFVTCIPSTIVVSALAVLALVVSPALAAVLGGVLTALGGLAAVFWAQVVARERREGTGYWIERGPRPRLFAAPCAQATDPERRN